MDPDLDQKLALLMAEAQKGNQNAYECFLLEASGMLRVFLSKRMNEKELVEDVLQDTLLSIHSARHTHIPGRPIGPWMYAICRHRLIDFYRCYRRVERMEISAPEKILQQFFEPEKTFNRLGERLREALVRLPTKQRKVVELLKIQDLSVKEVAVQMGMTESAVKVTAFRAYETVRKIFGVKTK